MVWKYSREAVLVTTRTWVTRKRTPSRTQRAPHTQDRRTYFLLRTEQRDLGSSPPVKKH
jgi:hypothetical protein